MNNQRHQTVEQAHEQSLIQVYILLAVALFGQVIVRLRTIEDQEPLKALTVL